jgi:hypothetical protein
MLIEDAQIKFGEWLPDLPEFNNPGLVEAKNCIPVDDSYTDFPALAVSGSALAAAPLGAFAAIDDSGIPEIYAGTATALYERTGTSWTSRSASAMAASSYWRFAQFDARVFATDAIDRVQYKTIGAAANFTALTVAPFARQIGVINRFLFLGDLDQGAGQISYMVQWSTINNPLDWPTPGGALALAGQAGQQVLQAEAGAVTAISGGQFWGLILQKRAITRFTYVGGDQVFQIDNVDRTHGCWAPQSHVQIGNLSYFMAHDGFYVTDGQQVKPIGDGKVDRWVTNRLNQGLLEKMTAGVDWANKCIYWSFPTVDTTPDTILIYSLTKNRFSWAEQDTQLVFSSYSEAVTLEGLDALYATLEDIGISLDSSVWQGGVPTIMGFSASKLATFTGASEDATFETAERDENPFGRIFVRGVRPLVTGSPTAVTVALAARDTQDNSSRVFGSETTRTTRTGVCDFRQQARFLSSRLTLVGGFDRAIGLGFDVEQGDQV